MANWLDERHDGKAYTFTMGKEMKNALLAARTPAEKKMPIQDYLCKTVTEQFGIMGWCASVDVEGETRL